VAGLTDEYTLQNNLMLADAAARRAVGFGSQPGQYDAPAAPAAETPLAPTGSIQPGQTMPASYTPQSPYFYGGGTQQPQIYSVGELAKRKGLAATGGRRF
jgi:hypothetical protein